MIDIDQYIEEHLMVPAPSGVTFSDEEIYLFRYMVDTFPEVILASGDEDNQLNYLAIIAMLAKTLGLSRSIIKGLDSRESLRELTHGIFGEVYLNTSLNKPASNISQNLKVLLYLLASELGFPTDLLTTDTEDGVDKLTTYIRMLEVYRNSVRHRGTTASIMNIIGTQTLKKNWIFFSYFKRKKK